MSSKDPKARDYYDPLGFRFKSWAKNLTYGRVYSRRSEAEFEAEMTALSACAAFGSGLSKALEQKKTSAEVLLMGAGRERSNLLGRLENINRALGNQDLLQDGVDYLTAVGGTVLGLVTVTGLAVATAPAVIVSGLVLGGVTIVNTAMRPDPGVETVLGGTGQAVLDIGGTVAGAAEASAPLLTAAPFLSAGASVISAVNSSAPLLEYSARSVAELGELRKQVEALDSTTIREAFGLDKQDTLDQIDKTIEAEERYQAAQKAYNDLASGLAMQTNSTCVDRLTKEIADLTFPLPKKPLQRKRPGGD